uniref:Uncharacterized protein n=1 Tax=Nothoprocta perdicaria TaxID=30464 RepID=A0A8C6ZPT3_NOTPE
MIKACDLQVEKEEQILMQKDDQKVQQSHVCVVRVMGRTFASSPSYIQYQDENLKELYKGRKRKTTKLLSSSLRRHMADDTSKLTKIATRRQRRNCKVGGEVGFVVM